MPPRAPTDSLGGYDLVRELGAGGFGTVYEARRRRLDKPVALKVLHAHMVRDAEAVGRFEREARAAARFRHPHIVTVTDVGEADGARYIEMELLEGESLKERLAREGALPLVAALDVLVPVFSAVAEVHAQGVVHRDIKPANVFLTSPLPGVVHPKLIDFGIARLRDGAAPLTETDAFLGSLAYMAPEQMYDAKRADARSDQWSLAVVTYECLTGRAPFTAASVPEAVTAVLSGAFARPRELAPDLPPDVEAAVLRALERDPARRHASVRDFGAALLAHAGARVRETFAASLATTPDAPAREPREIPRAVVPAAPVTRPPPRRALALAGAALAALAAAGAAWFATRSPRGGGAAAVRAAPAVVQPPPDATEAVRDDAPPPPAAPVEAPAVARPARRTSTPRPAPRAEPVDAGVAVGSRGVTIL